MSNVVTDHISNISLSAVMSLALMACSCGGNGDTEKAQALLDEAQSAFEAKDFSRAITLTDSIKNAYPREIDVRREALHLSTKATEGLTLQRLQQADSLSAVLAVRGDSLQRLIKFVPNPIEGYYVAASVDPTKFFGTNGIQARVSPDGDFYLMSSLKTKKVNSTSIEVSTDGGSASTSTVAHDGERNDRSMGAEVITFIGAECDSVGHFIADNSNRPITLTFIGSSTYSMPLPEKQVQETALLYDYATTLRRFKVASLEKERLSRAVEIARSQAARTYVEKESEEK
ncbi:MAG: hypothetical protein NC411_10240 [Bacteroides sp.]|nr:hypothetical protein [Bacteroides sp.]